MLVMSSLASGQIQGQLHIVDAVAGPHLTVQSAINAATSGDVILVRPSAPGTQYPAFNIGAGGASKTLGITAESGATVRVLPSRIESLAATDQVVIRGIDFQWTADPLAPGVELVNNAGDVWFEECVFERCVPAVPLPAFQAPTMIDTPGGSGVLTFVHCEIHGVSGYYDLAGVIYTKASIALSVGGTTSLAIWDSTIRGGNGSNGIFGRPLGKNGQHGLVFSGSSLWVSYSSIRGGSGGNGYGTPCADGGAGGDGIQMNVDPGTTQADAIDSTFFGGAPGSPSGTPCITKPWGANIGGSDPNALNLLVGTARRLWSLNSPIRIQGPAGTASASFQFCGTTNDACNGYRDDPFLYQFYNGPKSSGSLHFLGLVQATVAKVLVPGLTSGAPPAMPCVERVVQLSHSADLGTSSARAVLMQVECNDWPTICVYYSSPTYVFLLDSASSE